MQVRRLALLALPIIVMSTIVSAWLSASNVQAYSPDVAGARAYANDFCPDVTYPEDKIADYMWVTAPGGGNQLSITNGQSEDVDVIINFYATYCANWPAAYTNGATSMKVIDGVTQRLSSSPANITYGPKTSPFGVRSEWGTGQYNGKLNVSGWGTGWHFVCTSFKTTTTRPKVTFPASPSACFSIYLNRVEPWSINGQSYVRNATTNSPNSQGSITANFNDVVHWSHDLRNNSAYNMDRDVEYWIDKSGYSGTEAWVNSNNTRTRARGTSNQLFVMHYPPGSAFTVKTIGQQDVGAGYNGRPEVCQRIYWQDKAYNDGSQGFSPALPCVRVPYNFNLTPQVSGVSGVTTVGAPITGINPTVLNEVPGNAGATTVSTDVQWQLNRIEVAPGGSITTSVQENNTAPCTHYGNNCTPKGNGSQVFQPNTTNLPAPGGETVGLNTPVGTKICYALSVRPYSQSTGEWRHGVPVCVIVSKQPKVQVWGNDVRTRGKIVTGLTSTMIGATPTVFGSWVEYGGFSVGSNANFASASGLNNGNTVASPSAWNKLTFANEKGSTTGYGKFTLPATLPTITSQFIGPSDGPPVDDIGSLNSGTYTTTADDFVIKASNIGQQDGMGKSIIIVSTKKITIDGNILYRGPVAGDGFVTTRDIPQVVIIAKDIEIKNNTTQIDAWLLTIGDGAINTCSDVPLGDPLNAGVCQNPLTVNGPVATQHLHLRRTAGSDTVATAGTPAEVFNLRADAYVWAHARASQAGKAQTVYSVELPPRF